MVGPTGYEETMVQILGDGLVFFLSLPSPSFLLAAAAEPLHTASELETNYGFGHFWHSIPNVFPIMRSGKGEPACPSSTYLVGHILGMMCLLLCRLIHRRCLHNSAFVNRISPYWAWRTPDIPENQVGLGSCSCLACQAHLAEFGHMQDDSLAARALMVDGNNLEQSTHLRGIGHNP